MGLCKRGSMTLEDRSVEPFGPFSKVWTSRRGHRHDALHHAGTICSSRSGRSRSVGLEGDRPEFGSFRVDIKVGEVVSRRVVVLKGGMESLTLENMPVGRWAAKGAISCRNDLVRSAGNDNPSPSWWDIWVGAEISNFGSRSSRNASEHVDIKVGSCGGEA